MRNHVNKPNRKGRHSSSTNQSKTLNSIEQALNDQRSKRLNNQLVVDNENNDVTKRVTMPGFVYDESTDRYYRSSDFKRIKSSLSTSVSSGDTSSAKISSSVQGSYLLPKNDAYNKVAFTMSGGLFLNSIKLSELACSARLNSSITSRLRSPAVTSNHLHSLMLAASLHFREVDFTPTSYQYPESVGSGIEVCAHASFGLVQTSSDCFHFYRRIKQKQKSSHNSDRIEEKFIMKSKVLNINNAFRCYGMSNIRSPRWFNSVNCEVNELPLLAAVLDSPRRPSGVTILLRRKYDFDDNDREHEIDRNIEGIGNNYDNSTEDGNWETFLLHSNIQSKKDELLFIEWGGSGSDDNQCLYQVFESGIIRSIVELSTCLALTNGSSSHVSSLTNSIVTKPNEHRILSTKDDSHQGKVTMTVTGLCHSFENENILYVGFRNGSISVLDLRQYECGIRKERNCSNLGSIGNLDYRIDHMACLQNGVSLVAQDITGRVSIFDKRMNKHEYLRVVHGNENDVRKVRRFWLYPCEQFIITPAPVTQYPATLATWNLSINNVTTTNYFEEKGIHTSRKLWSEKINPIQVYSLPTQIASFRSNSTVIARTCGVSEDYSLYCSLITNNNYSKLFVGNIT